MRYLIFTLALISAFFVSAEPDMSDLIPPKMEDKDLFQYSCRINNTDCPTFEAPSGSDSQALQVLADTFLSSLSSGFVEGCVANSIVSTGGKNYNINAACTFGNEQGTPQEWTAIQNSTISVSFIGSNSIPVCPPDSYPNYNILVTSDSGLKMCAKEFIPPEPDPDCPAPTDNDPFVFGSGGGQTSVCFPAQNGRQCEIQTDENGGYRIPASYGSAEPVSCVPDIDPSPDPDPTPDPDPKPDPEPTDPTPETTELDAINKINENLDVINNNQKTYSDSNDDRLDRIAIEIQNSNQILSDIKSKPVSSPDSQVNNAALLEIAENTKKDLYNGECEGELCDNDIQPKLDEENAKLKEWIEKQEPAPSILNTYTGKIGSYVSKNFSGFTGTCQPFILDVSIAGSQKIINVSQHCEPYETYFKPLVEWLLWTFTAIALINISSQAFRAFSSL